MPYRVTVIIEDHRRQAGLNTYQTWVGQRCGGDVQRAMCARFRGAQQGVDQTLQAIALGLQGALHKSLFKSCAGEQHEHDQHAGGGDQQTGVE